MKSEVENLIMNILNMGELPNNSYNRKVLIIGLSNLLINGDSPEFAEKYYPMILKLIVTTLEQNDFENSQLEKDNEMEIIGNQEDEEIEIENENCQLFGHIHLVIFIMN